jgi:hypothetical protein
MIMKRSSGREGGTPPVQNFMKMKGNNQNSKNKNKPPPDHLDLILDQALDDFEEQSLIERASKQGGSTAGGSSTNEDLNETMNDSMIKAEKLAEQAKMASLLDSLQDPSYGLTLQSTLRSLSSTNEGVETVDSLFADLAKQFEQNHKSNLYPDGPEDRK